MASALPNPIRYTKALEQIKSQKKDQTTKLKELKHNYETLSVHKDRATELKQKLESFKSQIAHDAKEIRQLDELLTRAKMGLKDLKDKRDSIKKAVSEMNVLRGKKEQSEQDKQKLENELEALYEESDEELAGLAASFDNEMENILNKEKALHEKLAHLEKEKLKYEKLHEDKNVECGKLETTIKVRCAHMLFAD